jgi:hypothetical protein
MFPFLRTLPLAVLLATGAMATDPAPARAGWMGFRNDTTMTLLLQETVTVGKTSKDTKPQKIFANETVRDTPPSGSVQRKYSISDAAQPDKVLYSGQFSCPAASENVLFVIKTDSRGGIVIETIRTNISTKSTPKK